VESEWAIGHCRSERCVWRPNERACPIRPVTGHTLTAGTRRSGACFPPGLTSLPRQQQQQQRKIISHSRWSRRQASE